MEDRFTLSEVINYKDRSKILVFRKEILPEISEINIIFHVEENGICVDIRDTNNFLYDIVPYPIDLYPAQSGPQVKLVEYLLRSALYALRCKVIDNYVNLDDSNPNKLYRALNGVASFISRQKENRPKVALKLVATAIQMDRAVLRFSYHDKSIILSFLKTENGIVVECESDKKKETEEFPMMKYLQIRENYDRKRFLESLIRRQVNNTAKVKWIDIGAMDYGRSYDYCQFIKELIMLINSWMIGMIKGE